MFATLIGPYPAIPGASTEEERLTAVLADQLDAGLGMLSDGRLHVVDVDPGPVVEAWRVADAVGHHLAAARGLEPPLIKACLLGPWSTGGRADARVGGADAPARESAVRISATAAQVATIAAQAAATAEALFEAGAPVVQVTELVTGAIEAWAPARRDLLTEALGLIAASLAGRGHLSLAIIGDASATLPPGLLVEGFESYLFDLITSPDDWNACARVPGDSGLIVGVVDARSARAGAREVGVWGARYAASMGGRGPARTGICPGAGLERLDRAAAGALLAFTAEVARTADLPDAQLAGELDPLVVDARSAALGRGSLRPRRSTRAAGR